MKSALEITASHTEVRPVPAIARLIGSISVQQKFAEKLYLEHRIKTMTLWEWWLG